MTPVNETGSTTTTAATVPTLTTPGMKEFYLFTAEIEIPDVDEEKAEGCRRCVFHSHNDCR